MSNRTQLGFREPIRMHWRVLVPYGDRANLGTREDCKNLPDLALTRGWGQQ